MSHNREHNIDDLIALSEVASAEGDCPHEQTYYLVLEEYDGRGAFSNPPYAYGLSQVVHIFRHHELTKTVAELLQQYPDGQQFCDSKDEQNLVTHKGVQVTPGDTLETVFGDDTKATLYLRNQACKAYRVLEGDDDNKTSEKSRWNIFSYKCITIFLILWILKFTVVFAVLWILRHYGIL